MLRLMLRHLLQLCVVMIIRCAPLEPTIAIASLPLGAGLQCEMAYLCLARSERWLLRLRRWHSVDLLGRSMCRRSRGSHLSDRAEQCTHFTRCGPPLSGKPACREGRDDCRGCCDALTCSRLSTLCLSLSCGSYFRRLSARALGRGVRRLILAAYYGGLLWRLIGNGPGNL